MPYDINMAESSAAGMRPYKQNQRPNSWLPSTQAPSLSPALVAAKTIKTPVDQVASNPFHAPPASFRSPHSSVNLKHKLSPSPSPRNHEYDFLISSPRPSLPLQQLTPNRPRHQDSSSSPVADSPTPAYMSSSTSKLRLGDDDSPIRHVPGHSRSLAAARSQGKEDIFSPKMRGSPVRHGQSLLVDDFETLQAPPLFSLRTSQSQDCNPWKVQRSRIPRLSSSNPIRARRTSVGERTFGMGQKKAVSLGDIQVDKIDDSPFGAAFVHGRKARSSMGTVPIGFSGRPRRSQEQSISRSVGHKSGLSSGLSLTLSPSLKNRREFGSNSSISSASSSSITPPAAETMFENVKPNPEVFEAATSGIKQKFKPRDSMGSIASSFDEDRSKMPPPSVLRVGTAPTGPLVKRARSLGHRPLQTPVEPPAESMLSRSFDFVCDGVSSFAFSNDDKPMMPNTPVKKHPFAHGHPRSSGRMTVSMSQPVLDSEMAAAPKPTFAVPPPSTRKKPAAVPHLTVTTTSSPESGMDGAESSPTVHLGLSSVPKRADLLRRASGSSLDCSEEEMTPTKGGGDRHVLSSAHTPSPSPKVPNLKAPSPHPLKDSVVPRLSLPTFGSAPKHEDNRRLNHRQSHPAASPILPEEEDIFESRFVVQHPLGKGQFSTVLQVKERYGEGVYAVKKTRAVFDGVKGRLRNLEEVDILRHLSKEPCANVISFVDAWEQNRQLFIQTEACVGSLATFLEVFGHENERLDEARVWKVVRDIATGLQHLHSHGVIHFDIKPANILVAEDRSLKIADFGLATRWPRISPAEIIAGSGLGGSIGIGKDEKLEREGDRIYMPAEMLRGVFVMAADIFSFGLVVLESAMNIYLPDGGQSWHALRENNFTWLDLSPLSPELANLITMCMNADPNMRPSIQEICEHDVIERARSGDAALAPEDPTFLDYILTGNNNYSVLDDEGDIVMDDA